MPAAVAGIECAAQDRTGPSRGMKRPRRFKTRPGSGRGHPLVAAEQSREADAHQQLTKLGEVQQSPSHATAPSALRKSSGSLPLDPSLHLRTSTLADLGVPLTTRTVVKLVGTVCRHRTGVLNAIPPRPDNQPERHI